ncbi:MAG: DUF3617 domain-containing protein [Casimicrobium sp.]
MAYRISGALFASLVCASWVAAQTPQAGSWDIATSMQGAPGGEKKSSTKACLSTAQVASGFEQAIVDNAGGDGGSAKNGLKCSLRDIRREAASSSWQASCEGPRGPMSGTGSAAFDAKRANLTQTFELKTPFGAVTLKQVIAAQRTGDC